MILSSQDSCHYEEAYQLHRTLKLHPTCRGLSEFLEHLLFANSTGRRSMSPLDITVATTATLVTALNKVGPRQLGFEIENDNKLPFVCVVGDIFGKRSAWHSSELALARELCASCPGGCASVRQVRAMVDELGQYAYASGCSLVLVFTVPWGHAVGDANWRLFTVRQDAANFVDSERVLCSINPSSLISGSSILGHAGQFAASDEVVKRLQDEWRSVFINAATTGETNDGKTAVDASAHASYTAETAKIRVQNSVIEQLKSRIKVMENTIDQLLKDEAEAVEARVSQRVMTERAVLETDIESLHGEVSRVSNILNVERVAVDALKRDLGNVECDLRESAAKNRETLRELTGKLLVLEDDAKTHTKAMAEARKRELKNSKERSKLEAVNEAQSVELARLASELSDMTKRAEDAKRESAEVLARFVDSRTDAGQQITHLEKRLKTADEKIDVSSAEVLSAMTAAATATARCEAGQVKLADATASLAKATKEGEALKQQLSAMKNALVASEIMLTDTTEKNRETVDLLNGRLESLCVVAARASRAKRLHARATVRMFLKSVYLRRSRAEAAEAAETASNATAAVAAAATASTSTASVSSDGIWNIVAASKGLMSSLDHFVNVAQNGGGGGPGSPDPKMATAPTIPHGGMVFYSADYMPPPLPPPGCC